MCIYKAIIIAAESGDPKTFCFAFIISGNLLVKDYSGKGSLESIILNLSEDTCSWSPV